MDINYKNGIFLCDFGERHGVRSACQSVSQTITFFSLSLSLSALVLRMDGWMRNRVLPYFDFNMPTVFFFYYLQHVRYSTNNYLVLYPSLDPVASSIFEFVPKFSFFFFLFSYFIRSKQIYSIP